MSQDTSDEHDEILDHYSIHTLEQLRVISDELRVSILTLITARALTATQVAEALGQAPAKVHYHVRELERVGLAKIVETREKGGILEKYYRAVARRYDTDPKLFFQPEGEDDMLGIMRDVLRQRVDGFLRAARLAQRQLLAGDEAAPQRALAVESSQMWLTTQEMQRLTNQITELLDAYQTPRGLPDEREYSLMLFVYSTQAAQAPESRAVADARANDAAHLHRVVTAGVLRYARADLEQVAARGEMLDVHVFGFCSFARDVAPDLVRRTIARFSYQGVLDASDEVRAVLRQLEEKEP